MTDDTSPQPIAVKGHAVQVVAPESVKLLITAGLAAIAAKCFAGSDTVVVAFVACGGIVATWVWAIRTRLANWGVMKFLANQVGDDIAFVRNGGKT